MTIKTITQAISYNIENNLSEEEIMESQDNKDEIDADVLAQLKAKMNAKNKEEKMATLVAKKKDRLKLV